VDLLLKAKGAKFVHIRVMSKVPETEATGPPVLLKLGTKSKSEDAKKYIGKSKELETKLFFSPTFVPHRSFTLNFRSSFTCAFTAAYILSLNQVLLAESCKVIPSFTKSHTNLLTF
jgi:hypothetical protein